MKKIMFYTAFTIVSVLYFSCNDEAIHPDDDGFAPNLGVQVAPVISAQYSNDEISEMIRQFNMSRDNNVVPSSELQQKFKSDFPNAYDVEWEFGSNIYEVDFEIAYRDYDAYYDDQGVLLMYVTEIIPSELPEAVKNAISAQHPNYRIEDIDKINLGTSVFYKIELEHGDMETVIFKNPDGTTV